MTMFQFMRIWILGASLLPGLAGASTAGVSVEGESVNMRTSPSMAGKVLWQLGAGYPLKVVGRKGEWVHVLDFENDRGWVFRRFIGTMPHAIVKSPHANLRSGAGLGYRLVSRAEYGEVFRVLGERRSWVRVQGDGSKKGWIARKLLWIP